MEQTDAWILALDSKKDTSTYRDPKKRLQQELNRPNRMSDKERKSFFQLNAYKRYDKLSQGFRKRSTLRTCARRNPSLRLFLEALAADDARSA